jgi:hypothetical protein
MPLTALQKEVLALLAAYRSEESHFAGGVVLNAADDSARYSHDFDIFHELAEEVTRASGRDVEVLRAAGFTVQTLSRENEWEKTCTFRKAKVSGAMRVWKLTGRRTPRSGSFRLNRIRNLAGGCIFSTWPRTRPDLVRPHGNARLRGHPRTAPTVSRSLPSAGRPAARIRGSPRFPC